MNSLFGGADWLSRAFDRANTKRQLEASLLADLPPLDAPMQGLSAVTAPNVAPERVLIGTFQGVPVYGHVEFRD